MERILKLNHSKLEIFDFHRHFRDIESFERDIKRFNIKKFCIMPTVIENDFIDILSYIERTKPIYEKFKEKIKVFGCLDFTKDKIFNLELLEKQKENLNIQGVKLHPEQRFKLKKKSLKPYFDVISESMGLDIPIYIHTDWPLIKEYGFAPRSLKDTFGKIVSFFPEFQYIIGHAGGSGAFLNIWKLCKKHSNVYIETSMAPTTSPLEEVIWKIGPERLLFGSNFPYSSTSVEIRKIQSLYKISDVDKKKILELNAEVLFEK